MQFLFLKFKYFKKNKNVIQVLGIFLDIWVFDSVLGTIRPDNLSDKWFLYPIGTYEISVQFWFVFCRFQVSI